MTTSSNSKFMNSEKGKAWLQAKIRRTYGLRKATEAKAAARAKAIRRYYAVKNSAQKKAA